MTMFSGASDFMIKDSNLIQTINNQYGQSGIDILLDASVPGAVFDAQDHYDRRCFPGTREQYIADITNWVTESVDTPLSIYWMRGPAGVGKSAIAQTCAENLKETGYLGAAFFFTFNKHSNPSRLFTTIAYQLSTKIPAYRAAVDGMISNDKTLVMKKISAQFKSLIVEPLQELGRQGKRIIQQQAIFIDGLDECEGEDAQAEIIEIIASSVRERSTSFRWAVFSRAEPRIISTFKQDSIAPITHCVELPISHEVDDEVEMYLRGEFKNILQRRNCLQLVSSWPTDKDIQALVDAADGLFAHPAAVLRHVAYPPDWQFRERLQSVLDTLYQPGKQSSISPFSQLDSLYVHIMRQIPESILLSAQLLLFYIAVFSDLWGVDIPLYVTSIYCIFRISESTFRDVYHHLHAVIAYEASFESLSPVDPRIDLTRSFFQQDQWFRPDALITHRLASVEGILRFYHKSFHDFITDPARSGIFCVTTFAFNYKLYGEWIKHHHYYASSYAIEEGSKLVSAPGIVNSSASLSWPQRSEFVDSYLRLVSLSNLSMGVSYLEPSLCRYLEGVPFHMLRQLVDLDHRKSLIAIRIRWDSSGSHFCRVLGVPGIVQTLPHTVFECVPTDSFDDLEPAPFLSLINRFEKAGVVRRYYPHFELSRVTAFLRFFSRQESIGRNRGLYELGHGEKSVVWYWELDMDKRYFHQFKTTNYATAKEFYLANKFTMWKGKDKREDIDGRDTRRQNDTDVETL